MIVGAVIVSTPQDIALIDARKGANMFAKVDVPVLGIVQNMSHYVCPKCDHRVHIFGQDGARRTATEMRLEFLGDIPLDIRVCETSDAGTPIVVADAEGSLAGVYKAIAQKILDKLN